MHSGSGIPEIKSVLAGDHQFMALDYLIFHYSITYLLCNRVSGAIVSNFPHSVHKGNFFSSNTRVQDIHTVSIFTGRVCCTHSPFALDLGFGTDCDAWQWIARRKRGMTDLMAGSCLNIPLKRAP